MGKDTVYFNLGCLLVHFSHQEPGVSSGTPGALSRVVETLRNQEKMQEESRMFWRIANWEKVQFISIQELLLQVEYSWMVQKIPEVTFLRDVCRSGSPCLGRARYLRR